MKLFLDSGAFSADSQGSPIVLSDYIQFIKDNDGQFEVIANLDVIGDDAESWVNQKKMEEVGIKPLPVFHLEDDLKYLHKCLDYEYFALGGIAGAGSSEKRRMYFLDMCWDIICDKSGKPKSKVHGFGLASPTLLFRYPWYSFDSSSWVSYGRYGITILPVRKNGQFKYNCPPVKIFVTERSTRKGIDGQHFDTLSEMEQDIFVEYIHSKNVPFGTSELKKVSNNYVLTHNEKFITKDKKTVEIIHEEGIINSNFYRDFINYCFYVDLAHHMGPYEEKRLARNHIECLF